MAITRVDLALTTGLNDGTSWANAYQGDGGLVTAVGAAADGDTVYVRGVISSSSSKIIIGPLTIASATNPVRIIAVRTDAAETPTQSDLIPGLRTGNSTRAYDQTGANIPPHITKTGSSADVTFRGNLYVYGLLVTSGDNINLLTENGATVNKQYFDECHFDVNGNNDLILIGTDDASTPSLEGTFNNCRIDAGPGNISLFGWARVYFNSCDIDGTDVGVITSNDYVGHCIFLSCDLSGCSASGIFNISTFRGEVDLWNCKMPASHTLTTGTAAHIGWRIRNFGSDDQTALGSSASEQQLEIHTHMGTIDVETTVVRTGGASDGATGGFAHAFIVSNVDDNFVPLVGPWMYAWVEGDGTAKTLTIYFANGDAELAANLLEDDEIFLEVGFPSETGESLYEYLPDQAAPGDGGGRTQLLGTPADIATDSSTWGSGGNNKQKLSQAIAPDYQGAIWCRVLFSKSASPPTLYVDPFPEIV